MKQEKPIPLPTRGSAHCTKMRVAEVNIAALPATDFLAPSLEEMSTPLEKVDPSLLTKKRSFASNLECECSLKYATPGACEILGTAFRTYVFPNNAECQAAPIESPNIVILFYFT